MTDSKIVLREKIYQGIIDANKKLISSRAKENGFVIISKDMKIMEVSAKKIERNNGSKVSAVRKFKGIAARLKSRKNGNS